MRLRHLAPRERLLSVLRRLGPRGAVALEAALGVPRSTLLRLLEEQADAPVSAGLARRRRYAARRALRGALDDLAVYRVDPAGGVHDSGRLHPVEPESSLWLPEPGLWPWPAETRDDGQAAADLARQFWAAFAGSPDVSEPVRALGEQTAARLSA